MTTKIAKPSFDKDVTDILSNTYFDAGPEMRDLPLQNLREPFDRMGYIVLRSFLSPEEVIEIKDTFMAQAAAGPVAGLSETFQGYSADDPLARYPRMTHPHRHTDKPVGPLSLRWMLDQRLRAVLFTLFGEEPLAAQSMFYFKPAGARGQALHQDNFYLRVAPDTCIAAWFAVDDADEENGGLMVVPQTNTMELVCPEAADPSKFFTREYVPVPPGRYEVPIRLKAGDVLFFNGSLIHGSYPNTSRDRFRRSFICHYLPRSSHMISAWFKPVLDFEGKEVGVDDARNGGPCGTMNSPDLREF